MKKLIALIALCAVSVHAATVSLSVDSGSGEVKAPLVFKPSTAGSTFSNDLALVVSNLINQITLNSAVPGGINHQAQSDALIYAANVRNAGGPDMLDNGAVQRLAAGLSMMYNVIGDTAVVDFGFYKRGFTVTSGTNFPTLRNYRGGAWMVNVSPAGLHFDGTNSYLFYQHLPNNTTNSVVFRYASETNQTANAANYQWLWSLQHTNGYSSGLNSSLLFNSSTFQPAIYTTTLLIPGGGSSPHFRAVFGSYFNGGPAEGAYRGNRQFHNVFITHDGVTNMASWVDGLLSTNTASNADNKQSNMLLIGRRSDGQYYYRGFVQFWAIFNKQLSSNEVVVVDRAIRLINDEIPFVFIGDSKTFFDYQNYNQGREWPQQLWWNLGEYTNRVVVKNYAVSGMQASTHLNNYFNRAIWANRPTLYQRRAYCFIDMGFNDINNSVSAATTWGYVSNMAFYAKTNGYHVTVNTMTPMSSAYSGYNTTKRDAIAAFNTYVLDSTNSPLCPIDRVVNTASLVTDLTGTTQMHDGLHPTNALHTLIGNLVWGDGSWFRK